MAKIIFVLVFSIVLAMPFRTVLGQDGLKDLFGGQDLASTIDEAKKALGAASGEAGGQAALDDYAGGEEGQTANPADASLAGWLDSTDK
jgi:hypothetical protein